VNGRCVIEAEVVSSKGWIAAAAHDGAQRFSVSPFTERGPSPLQSQHRRRKRSPRRRRRDGGNNNSCGSEALAARGCRKRRRRRDGGKNNSCGSEALAARGCRKRRRRRRSLHKCQTASSYVSSVASEALAAQDTRERQRRRRLPRRGNSDGSDSFWDLDEF
jgi:hypothetical protein